MGWGLWYNDYNDMEMLKTTKVIKTGTSLCVVIPKNILLALKIERGDQVVFGVDSNNTILIRKISQSDLIKLKPNEINY